MKRKTRINILGMILFVAVILNACVSEEKPASNEEPVTVITEDNSTEEETVSSPESEQKPSAKNNDLIQHHHTGHEYVHGKDGYFNLLESGIDYELMGQVSGTCWICASSCAMSTAYQMKYDEPIKFDQIELVNEIYDDDREEGIIVSDDVDKGKYGGLWIFVLNELSRGFGDGLVMDGLIEAAGWSEDEIKEGIQKYGALYIGIPDTNNRKAYRDNYRTLNAPDAKHEDMDHSIAVVGWDDHFPKEYFRDEPSQDGAWITYNSSYAGEYYYVSYDTPFDQEIDTPVFMSVSRDYSKVLSHDGGMWTGDPVRTGDETTVANVFKEKGTLAAAGTYIMANDSDLTIQIMTPDFKECLYSQDAHVDNIGYHVFTFEKPLEVDEYAVVISFSKGAPVEGESLDVEGLGDIRIVSEKGQSYILVDGEWLDMSEKSTWKKLGRTTNNACIRALYAN